MVYKFIESRSINDSSYICVVKENPREIYYTVFVKFGKKVLVSNELNTLKEAFALARKAENSLLTRIFSLSKEKARELHLDELMWLK